jgi:hypothetical protein
MMQTIPFTSDPNATFTTSLNGVDYQFDTLYSERSGVWTFDLSVATGAALVTGVPILIGCDMLAPFGLGIGSMYAVDLTAAAQREASGHRPQSVDAGPEDLGVRVVVLYLAPGEALP